MSYSPKKVIKGEHGTRSRGLGARQSRFPFWWGDWTYGMVFGGTDKERKKLGMGDPSGPRVKRFPEKHELNDSMGLIAMN